MTDLERLFSAMPSLRELGPDAPYLRLHWNDDRSDSAVDADVEWGEAQDDSPVLAVAITERENGQRRAVLAAVFQVETGCLAAAGETRSLARSIASDAAQREATLWTLIDELKGLKPLESGA